MPNFRVFHLHGDNIVECERTVVRVRLALADIIDYVRGPFGAPVCPSYEIYLRGSEEPLSLTLYPGFGRWNHDILDLVRRRGGTLREAADVIITGVADDHETPLLAIEYCGALPAGNQAWQRSGRAYSFGKAQIPYLYVAELGGFELDEHRNRRAPRLPNPAVPFSYVSYSLTNGTPTLPIFVPSPGADESSREAFADVFAENELYAFIRCTLLGENVDTIVDAIRHKALAFIEIRATTARKTFSPQMWELAFDEVEGGQSLVDFIVESASLSWSKTAYIAAMTQTARSLMDRASRLAVGLTSSDLPMCIVPKQNRAAFADTVQRLAEGRIQEDFITWLKRDEHLAICWVMGFKPRGDDARPDRGLPPLTRMLIGQHHDLLTVIYGPAPAATWSRLHNNPRDLIMTNGLWEAILDVSDAILIDSSTDGIRRHGYLRSHWHHDAEQPGQDLIFVDPHPERIGENDVDTVLHLLLARFGGDAIFEGMCNPPGGDWSGISLQTPNRSEELRWLTLPRVSDVGAKRPDHVFQIFRQRGLPIILSVESKETAASVETNIGPRLTEYTKELMRTPASITRPNLTSGWAHSTTRLAPDQFVMASAVAFKSDTEAETSRVGQRAHADLLMSFTFHDQGESCTVRLIPTTDLGAEIAAIIDALPLEGTGIDVAIGSLQ